MSTGATVESAWRAALDAKDPAALAEACTLDVVFHSPITSAVRFEGRDAVTDLFRTVLEVYDDFGCVDEYGDDETRVVHLHARIGKQELDEVQVVRLERHGKACEVTMFVRPLPALTTLAAGMGPQLARRRSRWRGALIAALTRPLAFMTRAGDKPISRLVGS
jgi:hypothetical protein